MKNNKGFSIVELLVALALLMIALGLGYSLIHMARNSFERSEKRWIEQNEVVTVSNAIYHSLNKAYYIKILNDDANLPNGSDDIYFAYYINGSGETILETKSASGVTTKVLPGTNLELSFSKATYVANEVTFEYDDLLNISITSDELDYNMTTQVHLNNMNRDISVQGLSTGDVVMFQARDVSAATSGSIGSSWCFVATATYGSPDNPTVLLFRQFRDDYLLQSDIGTRVVNFYYRNSPPLAKVIAKTPALRFVSRMILYPVAGAVTIFMDPLLFALMVSVIVIALYSIYKRKRKYLLK